MRKKIMNGDHGARLLSVQAAVRDEVEKALAAIEELKASSAEIAGVYVANRFEIMKQMSASKADMRALLESKEYDPTLFMGFFDTWYETPCLTQTASARGWIENTLTAIETNVGGLFPADEKVKRWNKADYRSAVCILAASSLLLKSYAFPDSEKAYRKYAISAYMFLDGCFRRILSTSYDEEVERFNLDILAQQEQLNNRMGSISKAMLFLAIASFIVSLIALAVTVSSCSDTDRIMSAIQDQTSEVASRLDACNGDEL